MGMSNKEKIEWYNPNEILSHDSLFNFVVSPRGNGKTYGFKKRGIKKGIESKGEKQFMYVRRYKEELEDSKNTFFDDIQKEFPNVKFEIKGKKGYADGVCIVHFMALSTSLKKKSVSYAFVDTIIYDEFLIDKAQIRYLPREVDTFMNLYETVARMREISEGIVVKAILLGNAITIVNPYFTYFNVPFRVNMEKRFTKCQNNEVIVDYCKSHNYSKMKAQTRFGRLIEGTEFGNFSTNNEFMLDNDNFIEKKRPKDLRYICSLAINNQEVGVWKKINPLVSEDILYIDDRIDKTSNRRFALTKDDMSIDYFMIQKGRNNVIIKSIINYFDFGKLRFKNQKIKNIAYEILSIYKTR